MKKKFISIERRKIKEILTMKEKVICVKNCTEDNIVYDMVKIGKQYDMARIRLVDDEGDMFPDNYSCYIYEELNTWRVPLELFELLDKHREKKIDSIIK